MFAITTTWSHRSIVSCMARLESEHCTADAELNDLRGSIGGAHQIGRIVACIDVPELVAMIIDLRVEEGRYLLAPVD